MNLSEKFENRSNTKILSLDGGGLRGILTLGILEKLEDQLDTRLGSYFDIIGGTSTGSIIASGLATGKSVSDMITMYKTLGKDIFGKSKIGMWTRGWTNFRAVYRENYSSKKLEHNLRKKDAFSNITLGDQNEIRCGLVINSKRADTYSLWSVANHPEGKYYEANKDLKLWQLCKASSSAPYFFKPTQLVVKSREGDLIPTAFIDGGVSLANNPAWQLFLVATNPSYGFKRAFGEDNMHIVSIGTGKGRKREDPKTLLKKRAIAWASSIPDLFMTDALEMNAIIMNAFGKNLGDKPFIDSQFKAMDDVKYLEKKLFSFERYDVKFTKESLKELGFDLSDKKIESLRQMDHVENIDLLLEVGRAYSEKLTFKV
ncbi:MAG: patatin-like phospholipase family protein [Bacteroidota bacterium]